MSYRGYNVVAFTPSGRRRVQSILLDHLSRFTDIIDEYQIWFNTDTDGSQVEDSAWLRQLPDNYQGWAKLIELPKEAYSIKPKQFRSALFYENNTVDEKTIYLRFDDDITFIDDNFLVNILDFRINNPNYFLVMANIWNNSIISYIHQQLGNIPKEPYEVQEAYCMDSVGWGNGKFAEQIHRILIEHINSDTTEELFFGHADLNDAARFSISCFCFFGKDFAKFGGRVGQRRPGILKYDEEIFLAEAYPTINSKLNTVCGSALVAHYSFMRQRPHLDTTDILETYRAIGKGKLSESYYNLLETEQNEKEVDRKTYPVVNLPPVKQISVYGAALAAEKAGYLVVAERDRVNIVFNDKIIKTIIGKIDQTIFDNDIDRALAIAWSLHKPEMVKPVVTD